MQHVLLDFDGVIVRNDKIGKLIQHRSEKFVKKFLGISQTHAVVLNKLLYKKWGHTVNGIVEISNKRDHLRDVLYDYNTFVFKDDFPHDEVMSCITRHDAMWLDAIAESTQRDDLYDKFGLFTNAPLKWCESISFMLGKELSHFIDYDKIFTSDNGSLKPLSSAYEAIEHKLLDSNDGLIHFVDDTYINIRPIELSSKWKGYHVNSAYIGDYLHVFDGISSYVAQNGAKN